MDLSEKSFFEQLARASGKTSRGRAADPDTTPDSGSDPEDADTQEEEPAMAEAELAKAVTAPAAAVKSSRKQDNDSSDMGVEGSLTIDVYQTPNDLVVESAIAGVRPEDIDIDVSTDSVTVRGERRREHEVREDDYYYQECYWGRFSRSVILPQEIDPESAQVSFKNGILSIRLPKMNRKKSRKLKVKSE